MSRFLPFRLIVFCLILLYHLASAQADPLELGHASMPTPYGYGEVPEMVYNPSSYFIYCRVNATRMQGQDLVSNIIRINGSGNWDSNWSLEMDGTVTCLYLQADGKLLIGGTFSSVDGHSTYRIARLNINGTVDTSFSVYGLPNDLELFLDALVEVDGVIYAGFFATSGTSVYRVESNGSAGAFADSVQKVKALAVDGSGNVYIGGNTLRRHSSDGALDASFNTQFEYSDGFKQWSPQIYEILLHNSYYLHGDYIFVAGLFSKVSDVECESMIALDLDGEPITRNAYNSTIQYTDLFNTLSSSYAVAVMDIDVSGSKALCTGNSIRGGAPYLNYGEEVISLNLDTFTRHTTFNPSVTAGSGVWVNGKPAFGRSELARLTNTSAAFDFKELFNYDDILLLRERGPENFELRNGGGVIYYGSHLREVNGQPIPGIYALDENMQLDETFQPDYESASFSRLQSLPDGRTIFYGGIEKTGVLILNADGTLVPDFNIPLRFESYYGDLDNLWLMPTGKLLISGRITLSSGSAYRLLLLDLNNLDEKLVLAQTLPGGWEDAGIIDAEFQAPEDIQAYDAAGSIDGSIVISVSTGHEDALIRFLSDGSIDETYLGNDQFSSISKPLLESDEFGRVYVAQRSFSSLILANGEYEKIVRLLPNGALDPSFVRDAEHYFTRMIKYIGNGRLLLGGGNYDLNEMFFFEENGDINESSLVNVSVNAFNIAADGEYLYCLGFDSYGLKQDWGRAQLPTAILPRGFVTPPQINNNEGDSATFWLADRGANETYQWLSNGAALAGQTEPSLTLDPATLANAGVIGVQAIGPGGTVTRTATLNVAGYDFAQWGAQQGYTAPELADPDADLNGDGLSLNDKFLLRTDLFGPATRTWASPVWDGGAMTIQLTMLPGRRYWIDCSTNLVDWTPIDSYTSSAAEPVSIEVEFDPETPCFYQVRAELIDG